MSKTPVSHSNISMHTHTYKSPSDWRGASSCNTLPFPTGLNGAHHSLLELLKTVYEYVANGKGRVWGDLGSGHGWRFKVE